MYKIQLSIKNQKGFALLWFILILPIILLFAIMAIDFGNQYKVKGELQNAADAGALAGAGSLYTSGVSVYNATPDWSTGYTNAQKYVTANKVDRTNIAFASISTGYWNLKTKDATGIKPQGMIPRGVCSTANTQCAQDSECPPGEACLIQDVPAVKVRISKTVALYFAKYFGWTGMNPGASAVAVVGFPSSGAGIFPFVGSSCMTDQYFAQVPLPSPAPTIYLTSVYASGGPNCDNGQWTSFLTGNNNVPTVEGFMYGTTPSPFIKVGDNIWIEPGTKDKLYQDVGSDFVGKTVVMPIIQNISKLDTHSMMKVVGFYGFVIDGAITSGPNKQIYGHFTPYYVTLPGSGPGGARSNIITPPSLVQ